MANVAFLTVEGAKQGLISKGCNTQGSLGNKHQIMHCDEIMVLSCSHNMVRHSGEHRGSHSPLSITKNIDKSSPLLATAWGREEWLNCKLDLYRVNNFGVNEKYYTLQLNQAKISSISLMMPDVIDKPGGETHEIINFVYKDIIWTHHIAGTSGYVFWEQPD